jgi:hypothetical protein
MAWTGRRCGDWVHRYNAEGLAGLISREGLGPVPLLNEAQMAELLALVLNGPAPDVDFKIELLLQTPESPAGGLRIAM